uniref:Uncharacterized protein n=1 Tax=Panagrolaimus sp. PS1159 TaxID=55785 RepID=A0AC35F0E2_9BILA
MSSIQLSLNHKRYFTNPFLESTRNQENIVTKDWLLQQITTIADKLINRNISEDEIAEGCVYTGIGGIAFALLRVIQYVNPSNSDEILAICQQYIKSQLQSARHASSRSAVRYLVGIYGLHIVNGILCSVNGQPSNEIFATVKQLVDLIEKPNTEDEILNGKAGFLAGILTLKIEANQNVLNENDIRRILKALIKSGREYARTNKSKSPLMYEWHESEYLGAAHGLSGILQTLLSFWSYLDDTDKSFVKETLDWFLNLQTSSGNFPSSSKHIGEERGENELIHWCHGAGGCIYLFIVAYMVLGEKKYLNVAHACSELIWKKGILHKGPGLCHGLSGNGYAFLMMYRLTNDETYLIKAKLFALIMMHPDFQQQSRVPDRPWSLFEGWAGALTFLTDLLNPNTANFPLIPIPFSH